MRVGREELVRQVLAELDSGADWPPPRDAHERRRRAEVRLLCDRDDFARGPAADPSKRGSIDELVNVEAIAAVWRGGHWNHALTLPAAGTPLSLNPLLVEESGVLKPDWPSPRFAEEYRSATYLTHEIRPDERPVIEAARGEPVAYDAADPVVERLARRRVLLDVPEGW